MDLVAEIRTNQVSLMDVGLYNGGATSNILEMGDGYTELTKIGVQMLLVRLM